MPQFCGSKGEDVRNVLSQVSRLSDRAEGFLNRNGKRLLSEQRIRTSSFCQLHFAPWQMSNVRQTNENTRAKRLDLVCSSDHIHSHAGRSVGRFRRMVLVRLYARWTRPRRNSKNIIRIMDGRSVLSGTMYSVLVSQHPLLCRPRMGNSEHLQIKTEKSNHAVQPTR